MNIFYLDLMLLFFIEIIEANMQKGGTFNEVVNNLYRLKQRGIIYFFSLHLSLIYIIYFYIITQNNYLLILIAIKVLDLMVKLDLMDKITKAQKPFSVEEFFGAKDIAITPVIKYAGAVFYSALFFLIFIN